jgi:hypothetical protein
MNKKSTFFEEVAGHNLERFHSECIAWCMGAFKQQFCIPFIEKVIDRKCDDLDKEKIIVDAEVNNCDIKIEFEMNCEKYMIFIENKIKSSESSKSITDELLKNLPPGLKKWLQEKDNKRISQTEFYFLREKYSSINKQKKLFFIYLKPSVIPKKPNMDYKYISERKFNNWDVLTGYKENPWKTMTFYELSEVQQIIDTSTSHDANSILYNEYKGFIKNKFGKGKVDITNYDANEYNYGKFDFFRLIYESLKQIFDKKIKVKLESSSAHGNEPLVEFSKEFLAPPEVKEYLKSAGKGTIDSLKLELGVQLQGVTLKFNIHAKDYHDIFPKNDNCRKQYNEWCYNKLDELTKDLRAKNRITELRKNASKTKTGCSLSQKEKLDKNMSVEEFVKKLQEVIPKFLGLTA